MKTPEHLRVKVGPYGTTKSEHGNNGIFELMYKDVRYRILCSDGGGWEHVSISSKHATPAWEVMCRVKELFWDDDEVVMQLHPAKKDWVNVHDHCLHLWKPIGIAIPTPPKLFV